MKQPWMKWFPCDWLGDPALSLCTPATRGVWMDLLCAMHQFGRAGELRGTTDQLARLARCLPSDLVQALTDLQTTGAAIVEERNGLVTLTSRRLRREATSREATRNRVERHRNANLKRSRNAIVTAESPETRNYKRDLEAETLSQTPRAREPVQAAPAAETKPSPSWLTDLYESVCGITANGHLGDWLRNYHEDWIRSALLATERRKPGKPLAYAARILQEYKRNGGPDSNDNANAVSTGATSRDSSRGSTPAPRPGKFEGHPGA